MTDDEIIAHTWIAEWQASRYCSAARQRDRELYEELVAAGCVGLCEAAQSYRLGCGTEFATWATWRVRWRVKEALHRSMSLWSRGCQRERLPQDEGRLQLDALMAPENPLDFGPEVDKLLEVLDAPGREPLLCVVRLRAEGLNPREIGERLGYSREWARQKLAEAYELLRAEWPEGLEAE